MEDDLQSNFSGRRVLVLEDEWLIALDVRDMLESWGYEVVGPVASVSSALELIAEEGPNLAILDVNLDGETSEPVAEVLASLGWPFLVLTSCHRRNLNGPLSVAPILPKPVEENRLREELAALFSQAERGSARQ